MFDHLGIVVSDLKAGGAFYTALLATIGLKLLEDHTQPDGTGWLVYGTGEAESPFFVVAAGRPTFWRDGDTSGTSPIHFAFKAPSRTSVDAFHAAGQRLGAKNNGDPGIRRGRYYCAFLIDPAGNNIEAGIYADA